SAVAVVLAIGPIVLVPEAHEVIEREAIVAGEEIDAALGALAGLRIDVGAAADAAGECAEHGLIATPEAAHVIPVAAIPFRPAPFGKAPHLVRARRVPGFCDEFRLPQD